MPYQLDQVSILFVGYKSVQYYLVIQIIVLQNSYCEEGSAYNYVKVKPKYPA